MYPEAVPGIKHPESPGWPPSRTCTWGNMSRVFRLTPYPRPCTWGHMATVTMVNPHTDPVPEVTSPPSPGWCKWGLISSLQSDSTSQTIWKVKVKSLSRVWLFATPRTVAHQASLSMGFSRQDYWSGLLLSSPEDLPDPGIEPQFPALQADSLPSEPPKKPVTLWTTIVYPYWIGQNVNTISFFTSLPPTTSITLLLS